ncbi:MAG TPA: succinyl-diaminopimelate desuccinylase [Egibacteraceae bacterium]|nr:succinyl-diaminopimelate desuccinylase [Egibacteraceae bacterium]
MGTHADRLEALLGELLALPCVTGEEGPIADLVESRYAGRGERVQRVGHSIVVGEPDADRPDVLLVGHLDVVPPTDADRRARRDGDRIVGRGASDMKSGLAAAMDCFEDPALRAGPYNLLLVAYAGEEGPHEANELARVLDAVPEVGEADLAVVLEPTDLTVQLGCLGALHAEVTIRGRAAHSARPWQGENALTKAGGLLAELHDRRPVDVTVDGLTYQEVLTATQAWTANARNVVPDRFTVNVNYRFAPDKTVESAEEALRAFLGDRAECHVTDRAPAARPYRDNPHVAAFVETVGAPVEAKQAWTDVARFAAEGVPALNYGPGLTGQAHQAGEYVPVGNLHAARERLAAFLGRPWGRDAG